MLSVCIFRSRVKSFGGAVICFCYFLFQKHEQAFRYMTNSFCWLESLSLFSSITICLFLSVCFLAFLISILEGIIIVRKKNCLLLYILNL